MAEAVFLDAFCNSLNLLKPGWQVVDGRIVGPDQEVVRLDNRHESENEGHVDVQFVLDENSQVEGHLWDCVSGFGATLEDKAKFAAYLWANTTAGVFLELKYSLRGEFADHYRGDQADGFCGWHVICGNVIGFGNEDSAKQLQQWYFYNPVLPVLSRLLSDSLSENECPHGIKILFGGNGVAEVRVNGETHEEASEALENLAWPRLQPPSFIRTYVLVIHRELK